ncbi:MAG: TraB/GumN family protein [Paludibacter sp.]|nr:TraB/GumN family protein [Paludibacter sp.]
MRKRTFIVAFIALICTVSASAQLFWKVSGNGLAKPSYLFGTHHLIDKGQIKGFDKILAIAGQADAVVGEMDMTDMASMQTKIMQDAVMQGTTMTQLLSSDDYTLVDTELKQLFGAGLDQLGSFKPMMLQTMYVGMVYLKSQNLTKQPAAVDILFQKAAKDSNKQVIGLETIEQQSAMLFDSLPLSRQAEILVKSVKEKQKGIDQLKRLNEYYLEGNLTKLADLDNEDDDMTPAEKRTIYENRNNRWMKQIPELFKKQSCFVAVGCMHLIGDTGLIDQLRKAGYKVEAE